MLHQEVDIIMNWFDLIYKISLIATLFVLIKYTIETTKIRKITAEQKDLQLLPAVMFYIRRQGGTERPVIRNVGFGTAIDVKILPAEFLAGKEKLRFTFHLTDGNTTLIPNEERLIGVGLHVDSREDNYPLPTFIVYHDPSTIRHARNRGDKRVNRKLVVHFRDITGQEYETIVTFGAEGIYVSKAPERLFKTAHKLFFKR